MDFNNIKDIDELLDSAQDRFKDANEHTEVFANFLDDALKSGRQLFVLCNSFRSLMFNIIKENKLSFIDNTTQENTFNYIEKIDQEAYQVSKSIEKARDYLGNPRNNPTMEKALAGAGLQSEPNKEESMEDQEAKERAEFPMKYLKSIGF